ncbi:MAG: RNA polymerase sigma factor [Oscillospiraceae bacterium]|nr:RNA polymerase sigma factor [Oscillospiraceae bacterium]
MMAQERLDLLLKRLQQNGEKAALEEVYHLMRKEVYAVAYGISRHKETAEDVVTETFLRLIPAVKKYVPRGQARAFVLKIARNTALEMTRKQKREQAAENLPEEAVFDPDAEGKITCLSLVGQLKLTEREVIILHYYHDLTFAEIARITGRAEGTVKYRHTSALKRLKELYEQKGERRQ